MRLYLRFYLALLGSLAVFAIAGTFIWQYVDRSSHERISSIFDLIENALPSVDATPSEYQAALDGLAGALDPDVDAGVFTADRSLVATAGQFGKPSKSYSVFELLLMPWKSRLHSSTSLRDGRALIIEVPLGISASSLAVPLSLLVLALAVGAGSFPIVRRLTYRLERLQRGVESLGAGNLAERVIVEGRDEVAQLAVSFNQAAARIESLVGAHKELLANASHELRTPLARIRLAVELLKEKADPKEKAGLEQDIVELDRLIDEILLASRLDADAQPPRVETIDFLALTAEECARYSSVDLSGVTSTVGGDPHLLRRMVRNLLENALRHGAPPVRVLIEHEADFVVLRVRDAGAGVPDDQHERIFEPFFRRAESLGAGTGLGLALVRQIARRHGGDARCIIRENRTEFAAYLPRQRSDALLRVEKSG